MGLFSSSFSVSVLVIILLAMLEVERKSEAPSLFTCWRQRLDWAENIFPDCLSHSVGVCVCALPWMVPLISTFGVSHKRSTSTIRQRQNGVPEACEKYLCTRKIHSTPQNKKCVLVVVVVRTSEQCHLQETIKNRLFLSGLQAQWIGMYSV